MATLFEMEEIDLQRQCTKLYDALNMYESQDINTVVFFHELRIIPKRTTTTLQTLSFLKRIKGTFLNCEMSSGSYWLSQWWWHCASKPSHLHVTWQTMWACPSIIWKGYCIQTGLQGFYFRKAKTVTFTQSIHMYGIQQEQTPSSFQNNHCSTTPAFQFRQIKGAVRLCVNLFINTNLIKYTIWTKVLEHLLIQVFQSDPLQRV